MTQSLIITFYAVLLALVSSINCVTWSTNQYGYYAISCNFTTTGDEISIVNQLSFDSCASLCSQTVDCTHYTWNLNNQSTCTLKRNSVNKNTAVAVRDPLSGCGVINDGVDLSTVWPNDQNSFLQCNWNANFLTASKATTKSACYSFCQKYAPACTQYSWSISSGCKLFSGLIDLNLMAYSTDSDSICGYISYNDIVWQNNQAVNCTWQWSTDISNTKSTVSACPTICAQTASCTNYEWIPTSGNQGTCYLKSGGKRRENALPSYTQYTVCGQIYSGVTWSGQISTSPCDWKINRISTVKATSVTDCQSKCKSTSSCTHFTYTLTNCKLYSGVVDLNNVVNTYNTVDNNMICGYISNGIVLNNGRANCQWFDTITATYSVDWNQCSFICSQNQTCTHWSWTTTAGGTCNLYTDTITMASAKVATDPFQLCGLSQNGLEWNSLNYASSCSWANTAGAALTSKTSTLSGCSSACGSNPSICSFFAWSSPNNCRLYYGTVNFLNTANTGNGLDRCGYYNGQATNNIIWLGSYANKCTFSGGNLATLTSLTFNACVEKCQQTLGCTHYVFQGTPTQTGSCNLMSSAIYKYMATFINDTTYWCGLMSDGVDWSITGNSATKCDWTDNRNISRVSAASASACSNLCAATSSCTHYTYSVGLCWLKQGVVDLRQVTHTTIQEMVCGYVSSGLTWTPGSIGYYAKSCYWMNDSDLGSQVASANDCPTLCSNTLGCTHYIWKPATAGQVGGTCNLKGGLFGQSDAYFDGNIYSICGLI